MICGEFPFFPSGCEICQLATLSSSSSSSLSITSYSKHNSFLSWCFLGINFFPLFFPPPSSFFPFVFGYARNVRITLPQNCKIFIFLVYSRKISHSFVLFIFPSSYGKKFSFLMNLANLPSFPKVFSVGFEPGCDLSVQGGGGRGCY